MRRHEDRHRHPTRNEGPVVPSRDHPPVKPAPWIVLLSENPASQLSASRTTTAPENSELNELSSTLLAKGKISVAVVPSPGTDWMTNDPPNARIRSCMLYNPNFEEIPPLGIPVVACVTAVRSNPLPSSLTVTCRFSLRLSSRTAAFQSRRAWRH